MNLTILCQVKDSGQKGPHIVLFHSYEMSKVSNSIETESSCQDMGKKKNGE